MKKVLSVLLALLVMLGAFPQGIGGWNLPAVAAEPTYLETLTPVSSDRYTGNMGDSSIGTIGTRNGKVDVQGNTWEHGLEAWVARWNFTSEISWVWNEYEIDGQYDYLRGKIVIIRSYNVTNFNTKLEIIGDGQTLYTLDLIPSSLPSADLNINIQGVDRLTIKLHDNTAAVGGTAFGLVDFRLTDGSESDSNPIKSFNGHTYAIYDRNMTWNEAKGFCEQLGGHLVTITSQEEQDFIKQLMQQVTNKHVWWIGATDEKVEGQWEWISGEAWNYTNWLPGEPSNQGGREHYAALVDSHYPPLNQNGDCRWNDLADYPTGWTTLPSFICEWEYDSGKDTDGDGLPDIWETMGVDVPIGNGEVVHLPLNEMGANPNVPDIFVEVDWMEGFAPSNESLKLVFKAFEGKGIRLHIDAGSGSTDYVTDEKWGDRPGSSGSDIIDFRENINVGDRFNDPDVISVIDYNFTRARRSVFRYAILVNRFNNSDTVGKAQLPGQYMVFAMNNADYDDDRHIAGVFMHELGHTLGLGHGGGDNINFKSNYLSIMNYAFLWNYEHFDDLVSSDRPIDYSSYRLPSLDEAHLNEQAGVDPNGLTEDTGLGTVYYKDGEAKIVKNVAKKAINFDGWTFNGEYGFLSADVRADINTPKSQLAYKKEDEKLSGYNDWGNLLYKAGNIGNAGADVYQIYQGPVVTEWTYEEIKELIELHDNAIVDNGLEKWLNVIIDTQTGSITEAMTGTATFHVYTDDVADDQIGTVSWVTAADDLTPTITPTGTTSSVSNVSSNAATVTMAADDTTVAGNYYFVIEIDGNISNIAMLTIDSAPDITSPTPGSGGTITFENVTHNSLTLNWVKATDNSTGEEALRYYVYQKDSPFTMDNGLPTDGTLLNADGAADMATYGVSGLSPDTTYYFIVVVEDEAGNKAAYTATSQKTNVEPDITLPTVVSVTPSGAGASLSGNIAITFSEAMDATTNGMVQLNNLPALSGGSWSGGDTVFTIPYYGLTYSTAYSLTISGFNDAAGNTMAINNAHSFTTGSAVDPGNSNPNPNPAPTLTITPEEIEVTVGETSQLTASESVVWTADDAKIAKVDENGLVTGIKQGQTIVHATASDGRTASCSVTVIPGEDTEEFDIGIEVLAVGKGKTLILPTFKDYIGEWAVSDETVAKITKNGKQVKAVGLGTTTLTYEVVATPKKALVLNDRSLIEGDHYEIILNVRKKGELPTGITLDAKKLTLDLSKNTNAKLTATVKPNKALDKEVFWTSNKPGVATVDKDGNVTAVGPGTAKITAVSANLKRKTITVTVLGGATKVKLNKSKVTLKVGETFELIATMNEDALDQTIAWSSGKPDVATVNGNGVVTAVKKGKVKITATASNGKKAVCTVTVK